MFRTRFISKAGSVIIRLLAKLNIFKNAEEKTEAFNKELEEYKDAATYIKGRRTVLLRMFAATFLQRTSIFIISFFIFKSFGLSGFSFLYFLCIQAAVEIAVELFPIPGSVGISEVATYLLFGSIYGSDEILTAAAMLLTNGFSRYFPFIISSMVIFFKHLRMNFLLKKQTSKDEYFTEKGWIIVEGKIKDRDGCFLPGCTTCGKSLHFLYETTAGRVILKLLTSAFSKLAGAYMNSRISKLNIKNAILCSSIDLSEYEITDYRQFSCYNDFFTLNLKKEKDRCHGIGHFYSPCDSKLTVYTIDEDYLFPHQGFCLHRT
jgi:hypothetical protein